MHPVITLALLGFDAPQRSRIEAALQPTDEPGPRFCVASELSVSRVVVANGEDAATVTLLARQGRLGGTVLVGGTPRAGVAAQLPLPLSLVWLLQALNDLVRHVQPPAPATAPSAIAAPLLAQARAPARPAAPAPAQQRREQALLVEDNAAALRLLQGQLETMGLDVHTVRNGAQALERVARQPFEWVFLATGLEGMDSFHTCKTLKRNLYPSGRSAPAVVLMLEHDSAVGKLRADMAGADACLIRPLSSAALQQVVRSGTAAAVAAAAHSVRMSI